MNIRHNYEIYAFHPNCENQKSTEEIDGQKLYKFATVEKDFANLGASKYTYYLYKGNDHKEPFLRGETKTWSMKLKMPIYKHGS